MIVDPNGSINTTDNGTTNISGQSTNGSGADINGSINTSGNGSTDISGNSSNGTGVVVDPNGSINTTDNGTTNISGQSTNGSGTDINGSINTSGNGSTDISGNSSNGTGVVVDPNGSINTTDNGTANISGQSTNGSGADINGSINTSGNGSTDISGNSSNGTGVIVDPNGSINTTETARRTSAASRPTVAARISTARSIRAVTVRPISAVTRRTVRASSSIRMVRSTRPTTARPTSAATITSTDKKMWTGSLTGSAPIFDDGLRMTGGVSRQQYFINAGTPVKGVATTAQAGVQYPFARGLDANVWGGASLLHSQTSTDLTDYDATTHSKLDSLQLSLTADNGERARALRTNLAAGQIALTLGHQRNDDPSEPITRRAGNYAKLTGNAFGTYALSKSGNLFASGRISGQLASRNLDASEKLGLSGPDAVRAYRADEGSADEGVVASVGLYQRFPVATGHQLQVGLFNDFAYGRVNHSPWENWENTYPGVSGVTNNRVLAGYGVSVDWLTPIGATVSASVSRPYRFSESSWVEPGKKPTQYWLSVTWSH